MKANALKTISEFHMLTQGDFVAVGVSGGADSVALLSLLCCLRSELDLTLVACHVNHNLRGAEAKRDEDFVRRLCDRLGVECRVLSADVAALAKEEGCSVEEAARKVRYRFFAETAEERGKIATAHTADDNAETVLMHLVRGTGLKGLGGIMPCCGNVVRPMLTVTRADVETLLDEYCVDHIEDSSNAGDDFLRNRLRHRVMPLLKEENPRLSENLSATALRLRQDEQALQACAHAAPRDVAALRTLPPGVRARILEQILKENGVKEPEAVHIRQAEALVFSGNPSARASFPGGVTIGRNYGVLEPIREETSRECTYTCSEAAEITNTPHIFTVRPVGKLILRSRRSGDAIRLSGGTRSLKKLFIDRKIPASQRDRIPILCDDLGILGIPGIGVNLDRAAKELPATRIEFHL